MAGKNLKKILLINPPRYEVLPDYIKSDFFIRTWTDNCQPAGLLRIGSYLRENNHRVSMINCGNSTVDMATPYYLIGKRRYGNFKGKNNFSPLYHFGMKFKDFKNKLALQDEPDEIYITSFFTYQWEPIHEAIRICKEVFPLAKVSLGGTYATLTPDHAKKSQADSVHIGEFQETNNCRSALDLLEDNPGYLIIKTSRGCPGRCSYCAVYLLEGHRMRYRDPEDVVDEIQEKIGKFNIKKVVFWESNILLNAKEHIERSLDLIIKRNLKLNLLFPEGLNPRLLTRELLYKMREAGVTDLFLSLETSNATTVKSRFKGPDRFLGFHKKVRLMQKINFPGVIMVFVLAGMPGQDIGEVKETVNDVIDTGIFPILMPFTPIPGTVEYVNCFSSIKDKGLEDLHPLLWPCVDNGLIYDELCKLHRGCIDSVIDYLRVRSKRG